MLLYIIKEYSYKYKNIIWSNWIVKLTWRGVNSNIRKIKLLIKNLYFRNNITFKSNVVIITANVIIIMNNIISIANNSCIRYKRLI